MGKDDAIKCSFHVITTSDICHYIVVLVCLFTNTIQVKFEWEKNSVYSISFDLTTCSLSYFFFCFFFVECCKNNGCVILNFNQITLFFVFFFRVNKCNNYVMLYYCCLMLLGNIYSHTVVGFYSQVLTFVFLRRIVIFQK